MYQMNKKENENPVIKKIDDLVMSESQKLLDALDCKAEDLAGIIDVLKDRTLQSTEPGFPISLAKLAELQLQALKQKNDVLKNLTTYKTTELMGSKRNSNDLSISDILNSAALGAGLGSKLNMSGQIVTQPKLIDDNGIEENLIDVEITDISGQSPEQAAEIIIRDLS